MPHIVNITADAQEDIRFFKVYERRIIARGIRTFLTHDALVETNRRKSLEPNPLGSWEPRVDSYRVFYDVEPADDFEQEVAMLRQSEQFMAFLAERSTKKQGSISLDALDREIDEALAREATPKDE